MVNAIVLISGGLDSLLSVKLMQQTKISFKIVHFDIGLTYDRPIVAGQRISKYFGLEDLIRNGIEIDKIDVAKEFYSYILNIKNFEHYNACLEYKIFILQKAKEYMQSHNAQFIVTGDVLEQRPTIQGHKALLLTDKRVGVEGIVYRPLSAKLLEKSPLLQIFPPLEHIAYDFKGFSLKREELANQLGVVYTKSTQDKFKTLELDMGRKAFEIFEKQKRLNNTSTLNRVGAHFKLNNNVRCVIGRTPFESNYLKNFYKNLIPKPFSFGIKNPRLLFGFIYGTEFVTDFDKDLVLRIFRTLEKDIDGIQLYDEEGEFLGSKIVKPLSSSELEQYKLYSNDLFCPMTFQGKSSK